MEYIVTRRDISEDELMHYGVPGMKWGKRSGRRQTANRSKAKSEYEKHISKNGGYIRDLKRYQTLQVSKMTKDKRYSEYYTFDRKRQTVAAKGIVNDLGGTRVSSLTKADYEKGEQLVTKLTDDWRTNSSKMSELIT